MKLQLALEYRTDWGQDVRILFTVNRRKGAPLRHVFKMATADGLHWFCDAVLEQKDAVSFRYRYQIYQGDDVVRQEWNAVPRLFPWAGERNFVMTDHWKDIPQTGYLNQADHRRFLSASSEICPEIMYFDSTLLFRVEAPQLLQGQGLALVGSIPQLGLWETSRAIRMSRGYLHEWYLSLSAAGLQAPFEYKYVVIDESTGEMVEWENGLNRSLTPIGGNIQVIWDMPLRVEVQLQKTTEGTVLPARLQEYYAYVQYLLEMHLKDIEELTQA